MRTKATALFIAASLFGLQGCIGAGRHAGTVNHAPQWQEQHRIAASGVRAEGLPGALDVGQPGEHAQKSVAAAQPACDAHQEATNRTHIAYFEQQWQLARQYKVELLAANTTTNMDAVFTPLGARLFSEGYRITYYRCSPSFAAFASAYNRYVAAFNEVYTARVPIVLRIIDAAEADLRALSAAKDRLVAAMASGPGPATTQARIDYRRAMARLREYRLQDFSVDATLGGGQARNFKAADFWSRANAVMYQDLGDDYSGATVEEILGSPTEANLTITTSNSIAMIEVRHMSYGPGFCTVETRTSLGGGNVAAAPPLVYGAWHILEAHAGVVTMTISTEAKCDTGARSQVRYFK